METELQEEGKEAHRLVVYLVRDVLDIYLGNVRDDEHAQVL